MYSIRGGKKPKKKSSSKKRCKPCPPCPKRKSRKSKRKSSGKKRKMNKFFQLMLAAKKKGASSFEYNGQKYVGRKHDKLGMVYKKA